MDGVKVSFVKPPPLAALPNQLELVRPPAPGRIELVRRFLNTRDFGKGTDEVATAEAFQTWLREYRLIDRKTRLAAADCHWAQTVREAIRALAARNNEVASTPDDEVLQEAARRARFVLEFDKSGESRLVPSAAGIDGALGTILASVHGGQLDRTWPRLKACADESCQWAYYDHSKNGCSRWCSAETCGNRNKVKRYRERQAQAAAR